MDVFAGIMCHFMNAYPEESPLRSVDLGCVSIQNNLKEVVLLSIKFDAL